MNNHASYWNCYIFIGLVVFSVVQEVLKTFSLIVKLLIPPSNKTNKKVIKYFCELLHTHDM